MSITEEMKRSYLDYAMSVIVRARAAGRARRAEAGASPHPLFACTRAGYHPNRKYVKSARIVGDVMGKYHPHGDSAIYDALVRMAQDFAMRLPLIDGQGNFGSIDGDPPAAMRYTECAARASRRCRCSTTSTRTRSISRPTTTATRQEPIVLPARFPNLLVNGAGGIAVGMATNIPPHNLGEVIDAAIALIDNPAIDASTTCMEIVPGPDFPTGGVILGRAGIRSAYHTGRGSIIMRGKVDIETIRKEREAIIVTEIPYQVNKATMIEKIAELVREKRIEGISDMRDECDREGYRVVIELKRDAMRRRRAQPALPLHAAADLVRRQHGGARMAAARS